ncbi:MAG: ribose-5-phosphate isomerase [Mycobacteriales bacterium]
MRVYLGSDHAGFELKSRLLTHLPTLGHDVVDCGPAHYVADDDYAPYCIATGARVIGDPGSLGVVIGGSGNGEQIAANKVKGIRAILAWNEQTARLGREHNDAHVISIGARETSVADATRFVEIFLSTEFSNAPRHARRLHEVSDYESTGELPEL